MLRVTPVLMTLLVLPFLASDTPGFVTEPSNSKTGNSEPLAVRPLKLIAVREVNVDAAEDVPVALDEIHPCCCGAGLRVLAEIRGPAVRKALKYGNIKVSEARDDEGRTIRDVSAQPALTRFNRESMFFGVPDVPEDVVWIDIDLPLPDRGAKTLTVTGSLDLVVAEQESLTLQNVPRVSGDLRWPELDQVGLRCNLAFEDQGVVVVRFTGNAERLKVVSVLAPDGKERHRPVAGGSQISSADYMFRLPASMSGPVNVEVVVTREERTVTTPFRFCNLRLP